MKDSRANNDRTVAAFDGGPLDGLAMVFRRLPPDLHVGSPIKLPSPLLRLYTAARRTPVYATVAISPYRVEFKFLGWQLPNGDFYGIVSRATAAVAG